MNSSVILFYFSSKQSKANQYLVGKLHLVCFLKRLIYRNQGGGVRSGLKFCLIAVHAVFLWTSNSLAWFLVDVVGSFLIVVTRAVKKVFFSFLVQSSTPTFSLKSFLKKFFFFALYTVDKETLACFWR